MKVTVLEECPQEYPLGLIMLARRRAIDFISDDDEPHALLQAIICGYRRSIANTALYAGFQTCGLAHLVAVSGAHLVIVTGIFASILKSCSVSRRVSVPILAAVMSSYLVFSGMPISAIRATVMTSIGMFSIFGNRRPSAQNALGVGIFAIVLTSPAASVSVSFALSALSTAGILLFTPLVSSLLNSTPLGRSKLVSNALSMAIAANALSQLYASSVFHVLPLIGLFANVACTPFFPVVCALGLSASVLGVMEIPLAASAMDAAAFVARVFNSVVRSLASVPYASIPISIQAHYAVIVTIAFAIALWVLWPFVRVSHAAIAIACLLVAFAANSFAIAQEDAVIMLDVGQGDSFLIRSRGSTLLIDTGNKDSQLIEQLARCTVLRIDGVLLTHSDDDHVGSLDALERSVHVGSIMVMADLLSSPSEKNVKLINQAHRTSKSVLGIKAGDVLNIGAFKARVVWPYRLSDDGGNADSVCLLVEYDGDQDGFADSRLLFTGDAEEAQIEEIIKGNDLHGIDVLKVGHHGSKGGMNAKQLDVLKPKIALIGVGAGNRYGLPSEETLEMLHSEGCRVYRSDIDGQVKCRFSHNAINVGIQ